MSIHLIELKSDVTMSEGQKPQIWTAKYLIASSPGPGSSTSSGKCYHFEAQVVRNSRGGYRAKLSLDIPEQPNFAAVAAKLAEWAGQVAAGIMECGQLPAENFPQEAEAPPIDGFGFDTFDAAEAYGKLYDPPRVPEERYYDADGSPGGRGEDDDRTYYFVEVPKVGGVIVPAWGVAYAPPVYRGQPERKVAP